MGKYGITVGDIVCVTDNRKYVDIDIGDLGIVRSTYYDEISVKIEGKHNAKSARGYFYFKRSQLRIAEANIDKETTIMTGNYRVVEMLFIEGNNTNRTYRYACYDPSITHGDICVVKTAHHGFGIARVYEILSVVPAEEITREIVCKCDFSEYTKRVETRKRMAELKDLMNERAKQLQDVALFRMLAQSDADMATMVAEYETLTGGLTNGR